MLKVALLDDYARVALDSADWGQLAGKAEIAVFDQHLTENEAAEAVGVRRVEKDELFATSDIVSIHVILSGRTRGLVTARELSLMKPSSYLINTSRGPIVVEADLIAALTEGRIAGAGLDVYDREPPPPDHPFRTMDNVTLTPHLGYVTTETLAAFYADTLEAVAAYASGAPIRIANPEALTHARQTGRA